MARVIQQQDGRYAVEARDGSRLAGPFPTNAEAWRALDRLNHEPINPAEKRTDYGVQQHLRGA